MQEHKNFDYIIVGCGLAGIALCEVLKKRRKTYIVFDNASQQSSIVAAGLYNPVILKRFSPVWESKQQLELIPTYHSIEQDFKITIDYKEKILRRFNSIEEQNLWFNAADKPQLEPYLSLDIIKNNNSNINADYGLGEVKHGGRLDTKSLIHTYKTNLDKEKLLINNTFNYNELLITDEGLKYSDINTKHIVFAEGYGLKQNPFFNFLPLNGTKGEIITIYAPELKLDTILKSSVFIIPIGEDLYKVGATYNWEDKTNIPTEAAKKELLTKLKTVINCGFEVVAHDAGVRPTVKDRRPLVGQHPDYNNIYVCNGLGSRGVMIAPYIAAQLVTNIEDNQPLSAEIDIKRFSNHNK